MKIKLNTDMLSFRGLIFLVLVLVGMNVDVVEGVEDGSIAEGEACVIDGPPKCKEGLTCGFSTIQTSSTCQKICTVSDPNAPESDRKPTDCSSGFFCTTYRGLQNKGLAPFCQKLCFDEDAENECPSGFGCTKTVGNLMTCKPVDLDEERQRNGFPGILRRFLNALQTVKQKFRSKSGSNYNNNN